MGIANMHKKYIVCLILTEFEVITGYKPKGGESTDEKDC